MDLDGKIAVVTGASRGIGAAVATALAAKGVHLLLVARTQTDLDTVAAACRDHGVNVETLAADLKTHAGLDSIIMTAVRAYDGFDILINNAGRGMAKPMTDVSDEEFDADIALNLRAPYLLTQSAIKVMRRRGGGQVVQIASGLAYFARGRWSLYCAAKFGLRGFTEAVRHEVSREHIKIGIVAPGYTKTHFFDDWPEPMDFEGALAPEDIAHAVLAMCQQGPASDIREILVRSKKSP